MAWLLFLSKLIPVALSLLGLWIKAFDKEDRLRRPGKYVLGAIAATGLFVYFVSELDSHNKTIVARQERNRTAKRELELRERVDPDGIQVVLELAYEDKQSATPRPGLLQHFQECSLQIPAETGEAIGEQHFVTFEPRKISAADDAKYLLHERVTFTNFLDLPLKLTTTSGWNGRSVAVSVSSQVKDFEKLFASYSFRLGFISGGGSYNTGKIAAKLYVNHRCIASTATTTQFEKSSSGSTTTVAFKFNIPEGAFSLPEDYRVEEVDAEKSLARWYEIAAWGALPIIFLLCSLAMVRQIRSSPGKGSMGEFDPVI